MAGSGLTMSAFVVVHALGNLKVFTGAEAFDDYALWLRTAFHPVLPRTGLLWALRVVLLTALVLHLAAGVVLWRRGRAARGPYRRSGLGWRSFTARTMPVTGLVLLAFIALHVMDLTTGTSTVASSAFRPATADRSYAYDNLVASLQRPVAAAAYGVAMGALGLHLAHGLVLAVNDLGATGRRLRAITTAVAGGVAVAVLLGNTAIPLAVLTGVLS